MHSNKSNVLGPTEIVILFMLYNIALFYFRWTTNMDEVQVKSEPTDDNEIQYTISKTSSQVIKVIAAPLKSWSTANNRLQRQTKTLDWLS